MNKKEELIYEMTNAYTTDYVLRNVGYNDGINAALSNPELMSLWAEENGYVKKEEVDALKNSITKKVEEYYSEEGKKQQYAIGVCIPIVVNAFNSFLSTPKESSNSTEIQNSSVLDELENWVNRITNYGKYDLAMIRADELKERLESLRQSLIK